MSEFKTAGKSIPRYDLPDKAVGTAKFAADVTTAQPLVSLVLRSPHPHARIISITTQKARKIPGVRTLLVSNDCPPHLFGLEIKDICWLAACRTWLTERVEALSWERFSGLTVIDSGWPAIQCQESCSVLTGPVVAVVAADRLRDEGGYSPVTPTSGCASACSCKPASPTPTHPPPCRDRARGTAGSPSPA